jgi:uncharacterized protein involved in exopolysaccharide biosynthesis
MAEELNPNAFDPEEDEELEIDLMELARKLWDARKFLLRAMGVGLVLGILIALGLPKKYTVDVTLSPESGKSGGGSSLSGMASMLGLGNLSAGTDADALNVSLFPDIVASSPFILELFDVPVTTVDDEQYPLVDYLQEQKGPWWGTVLSLPGKAVGGLMSLFADKEEEANDTINAFRLTKEQMASVEALRQSISADVDKKTGVTTVSVTLQDPVVTATVCDSVVAKLQDYITKYRVKKAQQDCDYLEMLYKERQKEYYEVQQQYARFVDANKGIIMQSALTERERMQNDMNLAYQVYSQVATQLQVARAKVQEAKPVFAVVEPASVPLHPSGTSRKVVVLGFIFLALVAASAWVLFGSDLYANLKQGLKAENETNN